MVKCWANVIGGCSAKVSREHIVSACVLPEMVNVRGLPWCQEKPRTIGISSLTGKILCKQHNESLSVLDEHAGRFFESIKEWVRISATRSKLPNRRWKLKRHVLDGDLLERWFIKTTINLGASTDTSVGKHSRSSMEPDPDLVRICFGEGRLRGNAGLYGLAAVGIKMALGDHVGYTAHVTEGSIVGAFFSFKGFEFYLCLDESGPPNLSIEAFQIPSQLRDAQFIRHIRCFQEESVGKGISQRLEFKWSEIPS